MGTKIGKISPLNFTLMTLVGKPTTHRTRRKRTCSPSPHFASNTVRERISKEEPWPGWRPLKVNPPFTDEASSEHPPSRPFHSLVFSNTRTVVHEYLVLLGSLLTVVRTQSAGLPVGNVWRQTGVLLISVARGLFRGFSSSFLIDDRYYFVTSKWEGYRNYASPIIDTNRADFTYTCRSLFVYKHGRPHQNYTQL